LRSSQQLIDQKIPLCFRISLERLAWVIEKAEVAPFNFNQLLRTLDYYRMRPLLASATDALSPSNPVASNRQAVSQAAQAVVLDSRFDAPPSKRQEVHSV
jgi:hypothetical protein